jgi:hypothetical protein
MFDFTAIKELCQKELLEPPKAYKYFVFIKKVLKRTGDVVM